MVNTRTQTKMKLIEVLVAGNHIEDQEIGAGRENRLAEITGSRKIEVEIEIVVAVPIRSQETEKGISDTEMEVEIGTLVAVAIGSRETEKGISEIEMEVGRRILVAVATMNHETEVGRGNSDIQSDMMIAGIQRERERTEIGEVDLEADQRPEKG